MSIKVFQTNSNGKIEFTRNELEKLLNEIYKEGFREGEEKAKSNHWTWTAPSIYTPPGYRDLTFYKTESDGVEKVEPNIVVNTAEAKTDELNKGMMYGCGGVGLQSRELGTLVDKILEEAFGATSSEQPPLNKAPVSNIFADLGKEVRGL